MLSECSFVKRLSRAKRDILRGDSILAVLIFAVVVIFLANLVASLWQGLAREKDLRKEATVQNVRAIGGTLAKATEALLIADELSMLRRTIVEAAPEHHLKSCRVVLPDGAVVANSDPKGITAVDLAQTWAGSCGDYGETVADDTVTFSFPLEIPGRGNVRLEITAGMAERLARTQTGTTQMALACLALAAMLLVQRHARFRLKAIGAIHDALLAVRDGDGDVASLELDPELGREAVAWNRLLGQKKGQQVQAALEQVKESVHETPQVADSGPGHVCDALPHGVILVDENMRIGYANGAAAVLLQSTRGELAGRDVAQVIGDERIVEAIRCRLGDAHPRRTVLEADRDTATAAGVLRFTIRPAPEGTGGLMVIVEDITQHRVAEAARNNFLAKAAHELRTPLTNIRLCVENALENCESDPTATARYLNVINEESGRLERTVSEVLSVAEIEAGAFSLKRDDVRMDALLAQLKADHEPQARDKNITLCFDLPPKLPVLQADRDKLAIALHNLLGNALKYTPAEGQVTLTASVEDGRLTIEVADTGIGISEQEAERVFDKFYRSTDKRVADITGSGLGLSIAREVVRLHGGDITVESELEKGSTFTLTLHTAEEDAQRENTDAAIRCGGRS